jgi:hypothetical protein
VDDGRRWPYDSDYGYTSGASASEGHFWPAAGRYTVGVTVVSGGCHGEEPQTTTKQVVVDVA